jgi:hypothetical protein
MDVEFAFLCDAALESGGKVHVLGLGITEVGAVRLPAVHGRISLVTRIAFRRADQGKRHFVVRVRDGDGQVIAPEVQGEMELRLASDVPLARANMLIDLTNLEFKSWGPHEVTVTIDGDEVVNVALEVARRAIA